jgi:predicted amidophosphoribosyltransferase
VLATAASLVAQLLWPARCAGCDRLVPPHQAFCELCAPAVLPLPPGCPICAEPGSTRFPCARCREWPPPFDEALAALVYGGPPGEALLRLKHGHRVELARPLGRLLAGPLRLALARAPVDLLVPVPLHPRRLRSRGFNQALLLLRAARATLAEEQRVPPIAVDALRRQVDTPSLGHLTPDQRRQAVAGAFRVRPGFERRLSGAHVLVVDDVMTSGATAASCALALRAAGAASVQVVALARAVAGDSTPSVSVLDSSVAGTNVRGPNLKRTGT